jgi:ABC-type multidrug transport system ATPase subunit
MYGVETKDLSHKFSHHETALNRVNLQVEEGAIYGFLGPNGAGKTTTLKLILGLLRKQAGEVLVFGKSFGANRMEILKQVGSLIETPSLYEHLTATENLQLLQTIYQTPVGRIQEVLEQVGLEKTGKKRTGRFSLGMKQRLSIAVALLHQPALLILDEPTNGLDPNGMLEMRELLQSLNRSRGTTILISSHLLSEVERLVTHVGIINRGELLFQGPLAELVDRQQQSSYVSFLTADHRRTVEIMRERGLAARVEEGQVSVPVMDRTQIAAINEQLVKSGIEVYQIKLVENDLEQIFFDLIDQ